jgi:hypothetical protein
MKNDHLDKNEKCYKIVQDLAKSCDECECRHFLKSEKDLNCSIIAANNGPKTLQEIGNYYGISRMRVCQIEKAILKKLRKDSKSISSVSSS